MAETLKKKPSSLFFNIYIKKSKEKKGVVKNISPLIVICCVSLLKTLSWDKIPLHGDKFRIKSKIEKFIIAKEQ